MFCSFGVSSEDIGQSQKVVLETVQYTDRVTALHNEAGKTARTCVVGLPWKEGVGFSAMFLFLEGLD